MTYLTIGKVARLAEVGVETIRYYERQGLLDKPPRSAAGYRQYSEETVARLRFIKRAKSLGFSLREIRELLALRIDPQSTCDDVRRAAEAKIRDIEEKIRALRRMKEVLTKLAAECPGQAPVSQCPILDALEEKRS